MVFCWIKVNCLESANKSCSEISSAVCAFFTKFRLGVRDPLSAALAIVKVTSDEQWIKNLIVTRRGYKEDVRIANVRLLIGAIMIVIVLFAQFYNKKFPANKKFFIGHIVLYSGVEFYVLLFLFIKCDSQF